MIEATIETVLEALPETEEAAISARDAWKRVDCWSLGWTDSALRRLVADGRARMVQRPIPSGVKFFYWRASP